MFVISQVIGRFTCFNVHVDMWGCLGCRLPHLAEPTLPIVMITIFMALSHSCPIVFPNMELSVISVSAWIYIWNAWIMQIFSFLLHLTLSSIKSINHPIRWSRWPVVFPHTHKHRMKNCCWAISQKLMGETGHYMFLVFLWGLPER